MGSKFLIGLLLWAGAIDAVGAEVTSPAAQVKANKVSMGGDYQLAVSVPRSATYIGALRWPLYKIADCELHLFADAAADRTVRRLYWIQFESYLPRFPTATYNYAATGDRRMQHWGHPTWVNARYAPTSEAPRAGSDTEQVRLLVGRAGYRLPADMMQVRFVRLLDDTEGTGRGRRELMLIYAEDLAATGKSSADLKARPAAWSEIEAKLVRRAAAAFRVRAK